MSWWRRDKRMKPEDLDPYELGAEKMHPTLYGMTDLSRIPRPPLKLVAGILILLVVVTALRPTKQVAIIKSCTTPAVALSTSDVRQYGQVRYSITGPDKTDYILAIGAADVRKQPDGTRKLIPEPGTSDDNVQPASGIHPIHGCLAHGYFAAHIPPGRHTVTLFKLEGDGAVAVSRQPLEITSPR